MKKFNKLANSLAGLSILSMSLATVTSCSNTGGDTSAETCTVTFNLNGGSIAGMSGTSMKVVKGTTYGQLPSPSKTNSLFTFWTKGGIEVKNNAKITSDVKLKANYANISTGWDITEPATATERIGTESSKFDADKNVVYTFTFPGAFTIPDADVNNLQWFATISATVTHNGTQSYHSLRLSDGQLTKITGTDNDYLLSMPITCKPCSNQTDDIDNTNFLLAVAPNTQVEVSDLIIADKQTGKGYYCLKQYSFEVVPNIITDTTSVNLFWDSKYTLDSYFADYHYFFPLNTLSSSEHWCDMKFISDKGWTGVENYAFKLYPTETKVTSTKTYEIFETTRSVGQEIKIGYVVYDVDGTTELVKKDPSSEPIITGITTD